MTSKLDSTIPTWFSRADQQRFETKAFIAGEYRPAMNRSMFTTINPATEKPLAEFNNADASTVDQAVTAARQAFKHWRHCSPDQRKTYLFSMADAIEAQRNTLALLDSMEMGMPISMALEEVDGVAHLLRYNAELIDKVYGEIAPADSSTTLALSKPEPRGVIGVIVPWNFPLFSAILSIAPALAAGNCLVIKPSEQTPSSLLKVAEIAANAGLPAGVLNVVPGLGITTGATLAGHHDIDTLHFTGSTQVGRQLMVYAGQSNGKPVMLELGGKSPQIVFEDAADFTGIGASLSQAAFYNSGQICVAKTRLLVHENCKASIIDAIKTETKNVFTIGDPLDETTNFGPLSSRKQLDRVNGYLEYGQQQGKPLDYLILNGDKPTTGFYCSPVIVDEVSHSSRLFQEEIFGPVLSVISFKTDKEAIQLSNAVSYGLAATAWTRDLGRARRLARDLNAGEINICATTTPAIPTAALSMEPFGASGHGVICGRRGLESYQRTKAVQFITD